LVSPVLASMTRPGCETLVEAGAGAGSGCSRVMRRDYGSLLFDMLDQPQTPALALQIQVACYMALLQWEPRITLSAVTAERQFDGKMVVNLTGQLASTGESLSLTLPVS